MLLHRFAIRNDSAGVGKWRGGEGVIREFEILQGLQMSILSEVRTGIARNKLPNRFNCRFQRRTRQPYGMEGGGPGGVGRNTWIKRCRKEDGDLIEGNPEIREINLGGKATVFMGKGDRFLIETPGGGAWGAEEPEKLTNGHCDGDVRHIQAWEARGSLAERAATQASF